MQSQTRMATMLGREERTIVPGHLREEEIGFIEVRKPAQPCSASRGSPLLVLHRHRLEGRSSTIFLADSLSSRPAARNRGIRPESGRANESCAVRRGAEEPWAIVLPIGSPVKSGGSSKLRHLKERKMGIESLSWLKLGQKS